MSNVIPPRSQAEPRAGQALLWVALAVVLVVWLVLCVNFSRAAAVEFSQPPFPVVPLFYAGDTLTAAVSWKGILPSDKDPWVQLDFLIWDDGSWNYYASTHFIPATASGRTLMHLNNLPWLFPDAGKREGVLRISILWYDVDNVPHYQFQSVPFWFERP